MALSDLWFIDTLYRDGVGVFQRLYPVAAVAGCLPGWIKNCGVAMRSLTVRTVLLCCLIAAGAHAQTFTASSRVIPDQVSVGELLTNTIALAFPLSATSAYAVFPTNAETRGLLQLEKVFFSTAIDSSKDKGRRTDTMAYVFRARFAGSLVLEWPGILVIDPGAGVTNNIRVVSTRLAIVSPGEGASLAILLVLAGAMLLSAGVTVHVRKKISERRRTACQ